MKFKLDENLPSELSEDLKAEGHEVKTVLEEGLTGSPDLILLREVKREGMIFLTLDKGIADVRVFPPSKYNGLILFRPRSTGKGQVLKFARQHLPALLQANLAGHLFVVTERGIRIR